MRILRLDKQKLNYKDVSVGVYTIIGALLGLLIACLYWGNETTKKVSLIPQETVTLIIKEQNKFSKARLEEFVLSLNFRFPHIVLAQAKIESGNFKSPIFKENNNLFGMKQAFQRVSTNRGSNRGHALFDSWKESVIDYGFYYAAYLKNLNTEEEYYTYLGVNYAEDPNYVEKLKLVANKIKKSLPEY